MPIGSNRRAEATDASALHQHLWLVVRSQSIQRLIPEMNSPFVRSLGFTGDEVILTVDEETLRRQHHTQPVSLE